MSACFGFGWVAAAAQTEPARQRAGGERVGGVSRRGVISLVARRDLRIGETRKHPRPLRLPHYSHVSAARTRGTLRVARTKDEIEQKISRASRRARVPTHTYTKAPAHARSRTAKHITDSDTGDFLVFFFASPSPSVPFSPLPRHQCSSYPLALAARAFVLAKTLSCYPFVCARPRSVFLFIFSMFRALCACSSLLWELYEIY